MWFAGVQDDERGAVSAGEDGVSSPQVPLGDADEAEDQTGWGEKVREGRPPLSIVAVDGQAPEGSGVVVDMLYRQIELHYNDGLILESAEDTDETQAVIASTQGVKQARITVAGPSHTIASDYAIHKADGGGVNEDAEAEFLLCENLNEDPYPVSVRMFAAWQPQPEGVSCTIGPSSEVPGAFDITLQSEEPKVWALNLNYLRMDAPDLESVLPGFEPTPGEAPYESVALVIGARPGGMESAIVAEPA